MGKLALGKGINALIPEHVVNVAHSKKSDKETYDFENTLTGGKGQVGVIPTEKVTRNPHQPRQTFDHDMLQELKQSIIQNGLIQPITVRKQKEGFELISGERRYRACIEAGFDRIPAYILDVETDRQMLEMALVENLQRQSLNPVEVALGYQALMDDYELTHEEVARKVGKDRTTVTNFLRLLRLPDKIQQSLVDKKISMGHARALVSIENKTSQLSVWKKTLSDGLSVREIEKLISNFQRLKKSKEGSKSIANRSITPSLLEIEKTMREKLSTKVVLKSSSKDKGVISVSYFSQDDLERIVELICSIDA